MKKIFAILVAVFMLSTVAFAADVTVTADDITYDGVSDTIVYTIKTANGAGGELGANLTFDTTVFSFNSASEPASIKWFAPKKRVSIVGAATDGDITITLNVLNKDAAKAGATLTLSGAKVDLDGTIVFTAASDIVTTVKAAAPAHKDATVALTGEDANAEVEGKNNTYTGVWVGEYTVTPNDDTVTGVKVVYGDNGAKSADVAAEGQGQVVFKIAILKKAGAVTVTPIVAQ